MAHTPGPWRIAKIWNDDATLTRAGEVRDSDEADLILGGEGRDERWICWTQTTEMPEGHELEHCITEEDRANARLIAAAPDLLAACRAVKADMTLLQFTDGRYILDEFSAKSIMRLLGQAIAKAEGKA